MKKIVILFSFFSLLLSCNNTSELQKSFQCKPQKAMKSDYISDFNKNFKIKIPTNWKSNLYYNQFQSDLYAADTTKQLTDSFILETSFNQGELVFDDVFFTKTDSVLTATKLSKINSKTIQFQKKPAYWYLVTGEKKGFTYHQFNLLVKLSNTTYFSCNSAIYGENNVSERICEAISIINSVEFLQ